MIVRDRKRLAKLMVIQGVSDRTLAAAAGWTAHSYVARLRQGQVKTLRTEPAVRIAQFLGVPLDDLFLTKMDTSAGRSVPVSSPRRKVAA